MNRETFSLNDLCTVVQTISSHAAGALGIDGNAGIVTAKCRQKWTQATNTAYTCQTLKQVTKPQDVLQSYLAE
jgi:hypothetical protein